jgi:hypothetical protein
LNKSIDIAWEQLFSKYAILMGFGKAALQSLSDRYFQSAQTVFVDYTNIPFKTPQLLFVDFDKSNKLLYRCGAVSRFA